MPIFFLLLIISCFFTSCNLRPVYSEKYNQALSSELRAIDIEPISSINGAELYDYLTNILPKSGKARYRLKVQFIASSFPTAIEKNSDVVRGGVAQLIQYRLIDIKTTKLLTSGKFQNISSYNTLFAPYASNVEYEEAQVNALRHAAEEIRTKLILYFDKKL